MSRYHAFISYSLAADGELAPALQNGLQRLGKPWSKRRALEVFRDATGLSVNPDLWGAITEALDDSDWFVLLASPEAARSKWVNQEIEYWAAKDSTSRERLLCVLTSGTLRWDANRRTFSDDSDAAPPALREVLSSEPRYIDLGWASQLPDVDLSNPTFRAAVADVAAPIHGVPKDELIGEDVRQHRRSVRLRVAAVSSLVFITIGAVIASIVAVANALAADEQRREATAARDDANLARDEAVALGTEAHARALTLGSERALGADQELAALLALEADNTLENAATLATLGSVAGSRWRSTLGVVSERDTIVIAPDGGSAITIGQGGAVVLWDVRNEEVVTLSEARPALPAVHVTAAYDATGDQVAINAGAETVVFDSSGREVARLATGRLHGAAFSRAGDRLVAYGSSGISVWDLADLTLVWARRGVGPSDVAFLEGDSRLAAIEPEGLVVYEIGSTNPGRLVDPDVRYAEYDATGSRAVTGGAGRTSLRDTTTWARTDIPIPDGWSTHFNAAADLLITNSGDGQFGAEHWSELLGREMILWDLAAAAGVDELTEEHVLHRRQDVAGRFEPVGDRIVVSGDNDVVTVLGSSWRNDPFPTETRFDGLTAPFFAPDGERIVAVGDYVTTWSIDDEPPLAVIGDPAPPHTARPHRQSDGRLVVMDGAGIGVWSDDGASRLSFDSAGLYQAVVGPGERFAVLLGADGVSLRRLDDGGVVTLVEPKNGYEIVPSVAIAPDGESVAVATDDGVMRHDLDGNEIGVVTDEPTSSVEFDATGTRLLTTGPDGAAIRTVEGELVQQVIDPDAVLTSAAHLEDPFVIVRDAERTTAWDLDGARAAAIEQPGVLSVSVAADAASIVTAGHEGVFVWNTDGSRRAVISTDSALRVDLDPLAERVVSLRREPSTFESVIELWDLDGRLLASIRPAIDTFDVTFSADGRRLVAEVQGSFVIHEIPTRSTLRERLTERLNRTEFTDAECDFYGIDPCDSPIDTTADLADD